MTQTQNAAALLVRKGRALYRSKAPAKADEVANFGPLVSDLKHHPHAFVLACVMNRQMKAERAFAIPGHIADALGTFAFRRLRRLSVTQIERLLTKPTKLHRFPKEMSRNFHEAVQLIATRYAGDASRIWRNAPASAEVVVRFLEFRGVGPKIATMAANILARDFKLPFADYYCIDISADVHVKRVFSRLGLVGSDPGIDEVIYRARAINPKFPGLLDFPTWEIGRRWCHATTPDCGACYMQAVCAHCRRP